MPHYVDAERILDAFAASDPRMPILFFSLLDIYFERGPFEFDAAAIAARLPTDKLKARINAEELASLQPQLERFFINGADGWAPRPEFVVLN
jgi:hypothetical protein